jgi:NAD(P)-dependent dehydrogenase (short-subunit alcohol dehydrogenase family)
VACNGATIEEDAARLVDRALREYGRLSGAFNNAGDVTSLLSVPEVEAQAWHFEVDENLTSVFFCLKYQIPAILAAGLTVGRIHPESGAVV